MSDGQPTSKERLSPTMQQFLWEVQQKILNEANPLLRVELEREWREEGLWVEKPAG